jgi:hypothetical protein
MVLARWIKAGGLLTFVVIGSAALLVASRWPFTRDTVLRALQEKFASTVEFKTFYGTYFTPECVAEGVTFRRNDDRNAPPIATADKLIIQASILSVQRTIVAASRRGHDDVSGGRAKELRRGGRILERVF